MTAYRNTLRTFLTGIVFGVLLTYLFVRLSAVEISDAGAAKNPIPFSLHRPESHVVRKDQEGTGESDVGGAGTDGDGLQKNTEYMLRDITEGGERNVKHSDNERRWNWENLGMERIDINKSRVEKPTMNSDGSQGSGENGEPGGRGSELEDGGSSKNSDGTKERYSAADVTNGLIYKENVNMISSSTQGSAHKQMGSDTNRYQEENLIGSQQQNKKTENGGKDATTSRYMSPRDTAKKKTRYYTPMREEDFHQVPLLERPADGRVECPKNTSSTLAQRLGCRHRLPNVIGVGTEKCGTAAVSFFLQAHPQLVHSNPQEVFFWNRYTYRGLGWYMKRMPVSSKYQVTMEKTPSYFRVPGVPDAIKRVMPDDTKFLVVVRDPFKRAVSLYVHLTQKLKIPEHFIDKPVDAKRTVRCYLNDTIETSVIRPDGSLMDYNCLVENGIYLTTLKKWFSVLPRERFLVVDGDAFVEDPLPALQELEAFLGLPKYFDRTKLYFNEEKGFYCRSGYGPKASCLGSGKGRAHPEIDPAVEKRLRDYFRPHNIELEQFIGKKFNWA